MNDIIIVGAAGCGREVANWIEDINKEKKTWNILGFLDDNPDALNGVPSKYQIIGSIADHEPRKNVKYAMGIASPSVKKYLGEMLLSKGAEFASVIHPTTRIYSEFEPGVGLITYPNSKIATGCKI